MKGQAGQDLREANLLRNLPHNPSKLVPTRTNVDGSGTTEPTGPDDAVPLTSAMTPVGPPPLTITKSRVLTPEMKPLVIEKDCSEPKAAPPVQSPVFVPFRKMQP